MKGFDTSVLLAVLEGDPAAKELTRKLRGVEVATTEVNVLELLYLAARAPARARTHRRDAVDRLCRKLTVLPIDQRAVAAAEQKILKADSTASPLLSGMLGALEAAGCDELYTTDPPECSGHWRFRVTRFTRRKSK